MDGGGAEGTCIRESCLSSRLASSGSASIRAQSHAAAKPLADTHFSLPAPALRVIAILHNDKKKKLDPPKGLRAELFHRSYSNKHTRTEGVQVELEHPPTWRTLDFESPKSAGGRGPRARAGPGAQEKAKEGERDSERA